MRSRSLSQIAAVTGGRIVGDDTIAVTSVATDSRTATPDSLFLALAGERADGHDFVTAALDAGAAAALTAHQIDGASQIIVDDVLAALQRLAADERRGAAVDVVGVTGSTGKTLTKDLIAAAVGTGRSVHAPSGSFNNELGLPLTLLSAPADAEVIVTEMGARGVGHIASLCQIAAPTIGVLTNVGLAHVELFGGPEKIALAKGELVEALDASGLAVLNDDDPVVRTYDRRTKARVLRYGLSEGSDIRATNVTLSPEGLASFDVQTREGSTHVALSIPGEHMVHNALAALAVAVELGVPLDDAAKGLAEAPTSSWRMEVTETPGGVLVINDAYNANPTSMAAALRAARWMAKDRRLIAVLGTMRELGAHSFDEHEKVGELAARLRVDEVITVGSEAAPIARAAIREGVEPDQVVSVDDVDEARATLSSIVRAGDVVLLKGSRAVGLEALVEAIA